MPLKKYFFFLLTLLLVQYVCAQAPQKFHMRFGGNGYDVAYDVKQTLDNGYIITGSTSSFGQGNTDLYLVKLDSMGRKKFEKSFGNYNNDIGRNVLQLTDSSYVAMGYTNSTGFGGYDIFLVKTDKNGNLLWQKTIGGSDWDFGYSLQTTFDGGFVIAGTTYSSGYGNADGYVVKTDGNGDVVWTKTYGGPQDDEFKSVVQTSDGGFALAGYTKSYNDINGDAWVFKLDIMGDSVRSFRYNLGLSDSYNDILELSTGEFLTCGYLTLTNGHQKDGVFNKINNVSGQVIIQVIEGQANSDEEIFKVGLSNSSFGAYTLLCNSHENGSAFEKDVKLLLVNAGGGYVNGGAIGGNLDDELYSLSITKRETSKGYIGIGYTESYNSVLKDIFLVKYDSLLSIGNNITNLSTINYSTQNVLVYPNPFSKNIYFDENDLLNVEVFSIDGKLLYAKPNPDSDSLDLSFLKSGTYFIRMTDKHHVRSTQKLIKNSGDE